jgi:peptidoglycan-associated lipoprotein
MSRNLVLKVVLLVGSIAFLAASCGPKYPKCKSDKHCAKHGEYCVDQMCRECVNDDHCISKTGDKCKMCSSNNTCVKQPGCCYNDLDCPGGKCWKSEGAETGRCGGECRTDKDCPEGKECIGEKCVAKKAAGCEPGSCGPGKKCVDGVCVWACEFQNVYFDYNESSLTTEARKIMGTNVECANTVGVPLTVEGHCDERGTDEYNLALGQRRSDSVKRFMKDRGVGSQLDTISYGEEKPVCSESGESCWWRNRRAETKIK